MKTVLYQLFWQIWAAFDIEIMNFDIECHTLSELMANERI